MSTQIEQLEQQIKDEQGRIDRRDCILRLAKNADFRRVIIEDFSVTECSRYVRESINPMLGDKEKADALSMAQAAGWLKQWLNVNIQMGDIAAKNVTDANNAIEEIRAEGEDD